LQSLGHHVCLSISVLFFHSSVFLIRPHSNFLCNNSISNHFLLSLQYFSLCSCPHFRCIC
jgi:hypothetical protein